MINAIADKVASIANTLLAIGERVLEVSYDCEIIANWTLRTQTHSTFVEDETWIGGNRAAIRESIDTGATYITDYTVESGDVQDKYKIRILPIHPEPGKAFIVVELVARRRTDRITEDNWWFALDAAGDGIWDVDVTNMSIVLSEKWHQTFGHAPGSIKTVEDWIGLMHPEDLPAIQHTRTDYFEGKTKYYQSEFRIRCGNGQYRWILSRGVIVARKPDGTPLRFMGTHTDIHERKTAEESVGSSAAMLSLLIDNLHEGILVTDEHNNILFANQTYCDIYEISDAPESLTGMNVEDCISQRKIRYSDPDQFTLRTRSIMAQRDTILSEEWLLTNGKIVNRDYFPLALGHDKQGAIWKFRDITEQKLAEKKIADLRNFYENILNQIRADIVVFDSEQRYLFINPTAVKDKELRQWMIGKTDADYCRARNKTGELVERRRQVFLQARDEKREIEWEEMLIDRAGNPEYHLRYHYPVFDENGAHLMSIGYGINITDRVKAQLALKTSNETFSGAFNESGIGMALVDTNGNWVDLNRRMYEMTGYTREELLSSVNFVQLTHPEDIELDREHAKLLYNREVNSISREKRFLSADNKIIHGLQTSTLVWDNDGKPKFFITQIVDITTLKQMEQELRNKNADLEITRENLVNKISQLEDLSHIVAHNLRGPAGNIKLLAEAMLAQRDPDKSKDDLAGAFTDEEAILLIHEASRTLMDSLGTLMQITQIKLNQEIPFDSCDVSAILNDLCNQLQTLIHEKRAEIVRHLEVPVVSYPRIYLENILYNLLSNALKYSRPDITPVISITTRQAGDRVQLIVKDNGLGIDMERYGTRLFKLNEVFHQGFESKGVGLYITRTQVESFGGTIELISAPMQGCEFIVTL